MKTRRHHNNKGNRQISRGHTASQLKEIAKKLGIPYKVGKMPVDKNSDGKEAG